MGISSLMQQAAAAGTRRAVDDAAAACLPQHFEDHVLRGGGFVVAVVGKMRTPIGPKGVGVHEGIKAREGALCVSPVVLAGDLGRRDERPCQDGEVLGSGAS